MTNREKFIEKVKVMRNEELADLIMSDDCFIDKCIARGYCLERGEECESECMEIICEWLEQEADDGTSE